MNFITKRVIIRILAIVVLIAILIIGIVIASLHRRKPSTVDIANEFFTVKTSHSFNQVLDDDYYKITNEEELNTFKELYQGFETDKKIELKDHTVFIQTVERGSGSDSITFEDVVIDSKLTFKYSVDAPEVSTADMAYWYLVAIVPNSNLEGVNTDNWKSPIDVKNSQKILYTIKIDCSNIDLEEAFTEVQEKIKDIAEIKLSRFTYLNTDDSKIFYVESFNLDSVNKVISEINSSEKDIKAEISSNVFVSEQNYNSFNENLKKEPTISYNLFLRSNAIDNYTSWGITTEKGKEIASLLEADETIQNSNGSLNLKYNNLDVAKMKERLQTISDHKTEWVILEYFADVYWK